MGICMQPVKADPGRVRRVFRRSSINAVVKVKAHPSLQAAVAIGQGELWHGNNVADALAKRAAYASALPHLEEAELYLRSLSMERKILRGIAILLDSWSEP